MKWNALLSNPLVKGKAPNAPGAVDAFGMLIETVCLIVAILQRKHGNAFR
jgi:hypothetical protein